MLSLHVPWIGQVNGKQVPFALRYALGGDSMLLGLSEDRINGRSVLVWQNEWRKQLYKRLHGVTFFELGEVGDRLSWGDVHRSYGVGGMIKFGEDNQGLRFSIGRSGDDKRFSVSFNHVF